MQTGVQISAVCTVNALQANWQSVEKGKNPVFHNFHPNTPPQQLRHPSATVHLLHLLGEQQRQATFFESVSDSCDLPTVTPPQRSTSAQPGGSSQPRPSNSQHGHGGPNRRTHSQSQHGSLQIDHFVDYHVGSSPSSDLPNWWSIYLKDVKLTVLITPLLTKMPWMCEIWVICEAGQTESTQQPWRQPVVFTRRFVSSQSYGSATKTASPFMPMTTKDPQLDPRPTRTMAAPRQKSLNHKNKGCGRVHCVGILWNLSRLEHQRQRPSSSRSPKADLTRHVRAQAPAEAVAGPALLDSFKTY